MNKRGFQLLECLIVCALIACLAGIGFGSLNGIIEWYRLQLGARAFVSQVSAVRSSAISRNVSVSVLIDPAGEAYGWAPRGAESAAWRRLPPGVLFTTSPKNPVTFFSRGNAAPAGSFLLANQGGKIKVVVAPNGRVRWETLE
jgi:type II secretory pathway pseudopilin PulG